MLFRARALSPLGIVVVAACTPAEVDHAPVPGDPATEAPSFDTAATGAPTNGAPDSNDSLSGPTDAFDPALATASIRAVSPLRQSGLAGSEVVPPRVRVVSETGEPIENLEVFFRATGLTRVQGASARTGPDGVASAESWTLAPLVDVNRVIAEVAGQALVFSAEATSELQIDLLFSGELTRAQEFAFQRARDRWSGLLVNDLGDVTVSSQALREGCGIDIGDGGLRVDDILILASSTPIDGPGGILGQAGPCAGRSADGSPVVGIMEFDSHDLDRLEADGKLEVVILHEMAHVLGLGTLWGRQGLLANPSLPNEAGADTHFLGSAALAAFERIGGAGFDGGTAVPVENRATPGSSDGHWRESVFGAELMSPGLAPHDTTSPLSEVTAASFADLGFYAVNYDAIDPFALPTGLALVQHGPPPPRIELDCALVYPTVEID